MKLLLGLLLLLISLALFGVTGFLTFTFVSGHVVEFRPLIVIFQVPVLALLLALFAWVLRGGCAFTWPQRFSASAMALKELQAITAKYSLEEREGGATSDIPFETFSNMQLVSIYHSMNAHDHPQTYTHLLGVIAQRASQEQ